MEFAQNRDDGFLVISSSKNASFIMTASYFLCRFCPVEENFLEQYEVIPRINKYIRLLQLNIVFYVCIGSSQLTSLVTFWLIYI